MFFQFSEIPYIVVIGEVRDLKSGNNTNLVQQLKEAIMYINTTYQDDIASRFLMTSGHEFQGLFHRGGSLINVIEDLRFKMHPYDLRFGIGIGSLDTEINPDLFIGADGPGLELAKRSLDYVRSVENRNTHAQSSIHVGIEGDNEKQALSLNIVFLFLSHIEKKWTATQRNVISYMIFQKKNQTETASQFGVSQSNIQQILRKGNYYAYREAVGSGNSIFNEIVHRT